MKEVCPIELQPKPMWVVMIQLPDQQPYKDQDNVPEDELQKYIEGAKTKLVNYGYEVERTETTGNVVTVYGKKAELSLSGPKLDPDKRHDKPVEESTKYFMQLDDASRKYSLFANDSIKQAGPQISKQIIDLQNAKGKIPKKKKEIDEIVKSLQNNEVQKAQTIVNEQLVSGSNDPNYGIGVEIHKVVKSAIKKIKRWEKIPYVVEPSTGVTYNPVKHRLECSCKQRPSTMVVLGQDKYKYEIVNPAWTPDEIVNPTWTRVDSSGSHNVKRTLLTKYKVLCMSIPTISILAIVALILCFTRKGDGQEQLHALREDIAQMLGEYSRLSFNDQQQSQTRYVGDSLFQCLEKLTNDVKGFVEKHEEYKDIVSLQELTALSEEQTRLRESDSLAYAKCMELLNTDRLPNLSEWDNLRREPALSKSHVQDLEESYQKKCNEWSSNKENLRTLCLSELGTTDDIRRYLEQFEIEQPIGLKLVNIAEDTSNEDTERLAACELYSKYWPSGNSRLRIKVIKDQLLGITILPTTVSTPSQSQERATTVVADQSGTPLVTPADVEKKILDKPGTIFNALLWDNVKNNGKALYEQYTIADTYKERVEKIIDRAKNKGARKYAAAYTKVTRMKPEQMENKDKLYHLEKALGL